MEFFQLDSIIRQETSQIEVFICPNDVHESNSIQVGYTQKAWNEVLENVRAKKGKGHQVHVTEYHANEMCDSYDAQQDSHRMYQRKLVAEAMEGRMYALSYQHDNVPPHRFPNTRDLSEQCKVERETFRMSNRVFVVFERTQWTNCANPDYIVYIQIHYNTNVDVVKLQEDFEKAARLVLSKK